MAANVAEVGYNGYELYQGDISTGRFVFRTIGIVLGAGAGLGGPPGFLLGVGIDKSFQSVEQSYEIIAPQIQSNLNHFINNINATTANAAMFNTRR